VSARIVLDSSVVVAAMKPDDPAHAEASAFLDRLREARARAAVLVFAPPELWLEARVAAQKFEKSRRKVEIPSVASILSGLDVELSPLTRVEAIDAFFEALARPMYGRAPFANATDLVYLWVAWTEGATLVTLDRGLLKYHRMLCDVMLPVHVHFLHPT
jgi:predicted nucleic acid-binding protein